MLATYVVHAHIYKPSQKRPMHPISFSFYSNTLLPTPPTLIHPISHHPIYIHNLNPKPAPHLPKHILINTHTPPPPREQYPDLTPPLLPLSIFPPHHPLQYPAHNRPKPLNNPSDQIPLIPSHSPHKLYEGFGVDVQTPQLRHLPFLISVSISIPFRSNQEGVDMGFPALKK